MAEKKEKGEMSVREVSRRCGERTAKTHGHEIGEKIGYKGGEKGGARVRELIKKGEEAKEERK